MTLRLILGDQLHIGHSWFLSRRTDVVYCLMEARSETDYAAHHIQKVIGFFLAMRAFAQALRDRGHRVHYLALDDPDNRQDIAANLEWLMAEYQAHTLEYQEPDEWRLDQMLINLEGLRPDWQVQRVGTEHFLQPRSGVAELFKGKKTFLMETFYRKIRLEYGILLEDDGKTPLMGQWNFDTDNRQALPDDLPVPEAPRYRRQVAGLVAMLQDSGVVTIGHLDPHCFDWPVTRDEALDLLHHFIAARLAHFGAYQDAMSRRHWLLFHSRLSFVLNVKLLHPMEVVQAAIAAWQKDPDRIPYASLEGFVRQIIGWREYMRGVYWAKMPEYQALNYFGHTRSLPEWFWTGQTRMACLRHSIGQSLEHAYAHHIQRLMVIGNFALLLGVSPDAVDAWYLGIYMDAVQWVEITNTRGMSQFADGGIVGTKPYVSSANYLHKMSDYCKTCAYDHRKKFGDMACPFNSLYWDFFHRHRGLLSRNPRVGMAYRNLDRMDAGQLADILAHAEACKAGADAL